MSSSPMSDGSFARSFFTMISLLILMTIGLVILAHINTSEVADKLDAARQAEAGDLVAQRLQPVASINIGAAPQPEAASATTGTPASDTAADSGSQTAAATRSGDAVYQEACMMCHGMGLAGAPKFGDAAAWADRVGTGVETLYDHAINGFQGAAGVMPAKGGNASLSDDEVRAAVDHMLESVN